MAPSLKLGLEFQDIHYKALRYIWLMLKNHVYCLVNLWKENVSLNNWMFLGFFFIFCRCANNHIHQMSKYAIFHWFLFSWHICRYVEKILCGEKGTFYNNAMFEINNYDLRILWNSSLHCCKIIKLWCTEIPTSGMLL